MTDREREQVQVCIAALQRLAALAEQADRAESARIDGMVDDEWLEARAAHRAEQDAARDAWRAAQTSDTETLPQVLAEAGSRRNETRRQATREPPRRLGLTRPEARKRRP